MHASSHLAIGCLSCLLLAQSPAAAYDLTTHLFPHKDGEVSANAGLNLDSTLAVGRSGEPGGSVGWILYQAAGTDLSRTTGSHLTLYVRDVASAGTLQVFALESAVTVDEMLVEASDLDYDTLSLVASAALTSADIEKVIRLDLGTLLSTGTFHGLALVSADGLEAGFGSKDGHLQPLIELRRPFATPEQVQDALDAVTYAESAAAAADAAAVSAAASASAAAGSATGASASAGTASTSAAAASTSATAAAVSATAAAGSATSAASSATAASGSATTATAAAALATWSGSLVLSADGGGQTGYTATGHRVNFESPWSSRASAPSSGYDVASTVYNGKLYVSGGYNGSHLATFQAYDPSGDSWTSLANMPAITHRHVMAEVGGKIHAIGGAQGGSGVTDAHHRYNPATNTWDSRAALPTYVADMAVAVLDGKIHVIGGSTNSTATSIVATHYQYDPSTNAWTTKAPMSVARRTMAAVALNGKIHVIGGNLGGGNVTTLHEVYDPATNTWSTAAALPQPLYYNGAVAAEGRIYLLGGVDRTTLAYSAACLQYDPAAGTWVYLQPLSRPRGSHGYGLIGSTLYVAKGADASSILSSVEAYPLPKTAYLFQRN